MEHEHEHTHDEHHSHDHSGQPESSLALGQKHSHAHRHAPLEHSHPHFPDAHHRHFQYTSEHFQGLLKEQCITCSMSRAGEVGDNSAMESFFSSLKTERTARKVYRSRDGARSDVFD